MNRNKFAMVMLFVSALMGLLGAGFFYEQSLGLNFPLYMVLVTAVILVMAHFAEGRINRGNLWVLIPMLFFAVMVAIRASELLMTLNVMATIGLGTLFIRYLKLKKSLDTATTSDHLLTPLDVGVYTIVAPMVEARYSLGVFRTGKQKNAGNLGAVLRGLAIAIPIVLVFGVLLGSADTVFANTFDGLFDWLSSFNGIEIADHIIVAGVMGWLMLTALSYALVRQIPKPSPTSAGDTATDIAGDGGKIQTSGFRIGMIEATVVLGSVTALFAFFVVIQFAYLFGGQTNIGESLLNYSQYARRGFFELVAVAVLVLGMILYFDHITLRNDNRQRIMFRGLSLVIIGLTMVMLVSAWRRMELYELAYGFTHLRVLTHVFMLWLGVLLVFALLHLLRVRQNIFALGLLLSCIGYIGTLDLMNLDNYVAERNIQAYLRNESEVELDICYLRTLSVDAAPAMADLYYTVANGNQNGLYDHVGWWIEGHKVNKARIGPMSAHHVAYVFMDFSFSGGSLSVLPELDEDVQYACYNPYRF